MANPQEIIQTDKRSEGDLASQLSKKLSKNLYIALASPIGSNTAAVKNELVSTLQVYGYRVVQIKLTDHFDQVISELKIGGKVPYQPDAAKSVFFNSYRLKQNKGNFLRETLDDKSILANIAINEIHSRRLQFGLEAAQRKEPGLHPVNIEDVEDEVTNKYQQIASGERIAFIIDQLKRPEEVNLLRQVYGNLFFLYAVVETRRSRLKYLESASAGCSELEAKELVDIDRKESTADDFGQNVLKTVLDADYFHNNNNNDDEKRRETVGRFIGLIHGRPGLAPSQEEFGMFQSVSASFGSLCLSRQVGAAILDKHGNLLSVGRNDVPKFGGGLYENGDGSPEDSRCVHGGQCHNDLHKIGLTKEVEDIVSKYVTDANISNKIVDEIKKTKIKDIIEYSRSIHAEMDALISLSRKGIKIEPDTTLYTTTFPCHMCARHIVTAGIWRVIYIEPYEKSLAIDLHSDSMTTTNPVDEGKEIPSRVEVRSFQGVAPRRYSAFFNSLDERKNSAGEVIDYPDSKRPIKDVHKHYVVDLFELEGKCLVSYEEKLKST